MPLMRTKKASLQKYLDKRILCNRKMSYYEDNPGFQEMLMLSGKQRQIELEDEDRERERE